MPTISAVMKPQSTLATVVLYASVLTGSLGCTTSGHQAEGQPVTMGATTIASTMDPAPLTPGAPLSAPTDSPTTVAQAAEEPIPPTIWDTLRGLFSRPDPDHTTQPKENRVTDNLSAVEEAPISQGDELPLAATSSQGQNDTDRQADVGAGDDDPIVEESAAAIDLWQRLRAGFTLPAHDHSRVAPEIAWYAKHQSYLDRVSERARPFLFHILEEIERRDIPTEIALLPIVESAFQPFAYSHGRAAGIWQFIPATGKRYGLRQNWWYDGRRDVIASTTAALDYLEDLHQHFDGDWLLALAAYNSGGGTVRKAIKRNRRAGKATDFWSLHLPQETRGYVPKLLAISAVVARPHHYSVALKPIPNEPYVMTVDAGSQIDLALAAELADLSLEQLYRLNPGFNRWATDPDGPHQLLLPITHAQGFKERLAMVTPDKRVQWTRHRVRNGETLSHIAQHYQTTIPLLREVNNLRGNAIRADKYLIVPTSTRSLSNYSLTADQRRKAVLAKNGKGTKVLHSVQQGDSLWDISRSYNVSMKQLANWNNMGLRDYLKPGQKLVVWLDHNNTKTASNMTRLDVSLTGATIQPIRYVVRRGDSLARISKRFNVSVAELRQWNALPKDKYLQPGQRLRVYVDITKQTGNI